jgi:hypothetical protein
MRYILPRCELDKQRLKHKHECPQIYAMTVQSPWVNGRAVSDIKCLPPAQTLSPWIRIPVEALMSVLCLL